MEAGSDHTGERGALSSSDEEGGGAGSWSSRNPQEEGASCVDSLVRSEETPPRGPCLRPPARAVLVHPGLLPSEGEEPCLVSFFPAAVINTVQPCAGAKRVLNAAHTVLLGAF